MPDQSSRPGLKTLRLCRLLEGVTNVFAQATTRVVILSSFQIGSTRGRLIVLVGLLVGLSQMVRYMALALVPVTIVAPIMRMQSLFRIYFSWILTREYEVFDRNVIVGTLISVAGAILITLPPELVVNWLPLPGGIRSVLTWRWP